MLIGLIPALASAQYTIVLKNGRRVTTQAYREEGSAIRVFGLGGEFTIPRDQVQTILRAEEGAGRGLDLRETPAAADTGATSAARPPAPAIERPAAPPAERQETPEEQRAREEDEYRKKVQDVTERLKAAQNNFLNASRGSSSPEPGVLTGDDAIRRRADDLNARLRDTQNNPGGQSDGGPVRLESPSPFTGTPPTVTEIAPGAQPPSVAPPAPGYTSSERQLSDLRGDLTQLTREREKLIQEMKQKNYQSGNLFLDQ
ncbi:MAG TPA: hypothetical protein VHL99_04500 [Candidatus Binatia bacterium]|nr:hypothetical protein [Candidatus Binatia bacterium]